LSCDHDRAIKARGGETKKEDIGKKTTYVLFSTGYLLTLILLASALGFVGLRRGRGHSARSYVVDGRKKGTSDNSWLIVIVMKFWGGADAWRLTSGSLSVLVVH
jgi:hypothetical protein